MKMSSFVSAVVLFTLAAFQATPARGAVTNAATRVSFSDGTSATCRVTRATSHHVWLKFATGIRRYARADIVSPQIEATEAQPAGAGKTHARMAAGLGKRSWGGAKVRSVKNSGGSLWVSIAVDDNFTAGMIATGFWSDAWEVFRVAFSQRGQRGTVHVTGVFPAEDDRGRTVWRTVGEVGLSRGQFEKLSRSRNARLDLKGYGYFARM